MDTISIILNLLEQKGAEQKDLTDYLGLKKQAFSEWKSGRSRSYKKIYHRNSKLFQRIHRLPLRQRTKRNAHHPDGR